MTKKTKPLKQPEAFSLSNGATVYLQFRPEGDSLVIDALAPAAGKFSLTDARKIIKVMKKLVDAIGTSNAKT